MNKYLRFILLSIESWIWFNVSCKRVRIGELLAAALALPLPQTEQKDKISPKDRLINYCRFFGHFVYRIDGANVGIIFYRSQKMAFEFRKGLDGEREQNMRNLYETLSEKDRRRFAAFQARAAGPWSD
ncbi:MAG: hypothetical protein AB4372_12665 [Xenococcus sp. (in: cyanobacteria)]